MTKFLSSAWSGALVLAFSWGGPSIQRAAAAPVGVIGKASATTPTPSPAPVLVLPSVDYPSLIAARDSVESLIRHHVDLTAPTTRMTLQAVHFKYWYAHASADGWAFHITVGDTNGCPNNLVENALTTAGWEPKYDYMADGPDGEIMGMQTKHFLCVIEGQWDGGDDSDPSYVPAPGCEVIVTCVPRREDDALPP